MEGFQGGLQRREDQQDQGEYDQRRGREDVPHDHSQAVAPQHGWHDQGRGLEVHQGPPGARGVQQPQVEDHLRQGVAHDRDVGQGHGLLDVEAGEHHEDGHVDAAPTDPGSARQKRYDEDGGEAPEILRQDREERLVHADRLALTQRRPLPAHAQGEVRARVVTTLRVDAGLVAAVDVAGGVYDRPGGERTARDPRVVASFKHQRTSSDSCGTKCTSAWEPRRRCSCAGQQGRSGGGRSGAREGLRPALRRWGPPSAARRGGHAADQLATAADQLATRRPSQGSWQRAAALP
mmetsp:Transcript_1565/g.4738  ORF Transcript_1565/g.4738 Transcript_1565/m.4738 type:complete len:292 (-) Transcript_1565:43-918(-)